jgi:hypothetical protein
LDSTEALPQECTGFGRTARIGERFGDPANEGSVILANMNLKTHDASSFLATAIGG